MSYCLGQKELLTVIYPDTLWTIQIWPSGFIPSFESSFRWNGDRVQLFLLFLRIAIIPSLVSYSMWNVELTLVKNEYIAYCSLMCVTMIPTKCKIITVHTGRPDNPFIILQSLVRAIFHPLQVERAQLTFHRQYWSSQCRPCMLGTLALNVVVSLERMLDWL